jgi:hypothetical protein
LARPAVPCRAGFLAQARPLGEGKSIRSTNFRCRQKKKPPGEGRPGAD